MYKAENGKLIISQCRKHY
ncbi:MAG: hypothetical protein ABJ313_11345 [Cyclobacteriaceae bacterium]